MSHRAGPDHTRSVDDIPDDRTDDQADDTDDTDGAADASARSVVTQSGAGAGPPGRAGALVVEFCGEEHRVADRLTVGRCADLELDTNPYLHRVVFEVLHDREVWWLRNVGRRIVLTVRDSLAATTTALAPGSAAALTFPSGTVRFRAGPITYELGLVVELLERDADLRTGDPDAAPRTLEWGQVELNPEQRLLVLALCEPRLLDPDDGRVPPARVAARRLGWTPSKYHRKLDNLCAKLDRAGVGGVVGDLATFATRRREVLVEHAIASGWVGVEDLVDLDGTGTNRTP